MDSDSSTQIWNNFVQPFQIENRSARGRLVRIGSLIESVTARHEYPWPVTVLLSEMLALTAVVAGALKFDGVLTLQTKGDGPIKTLMADITSDNEMRGYAQFDQQHFHNSNAFGMSLQSPVAELLGAGYLAFTVDQGPDTDRYQGIVELVGRTLTDCAHAYFHQSEQLQAVIKLATLPANSPGPGAAALMVQRLPGDGRTTMSGDVEEDEADDAWFRTVALMGSCTNEELLDNDLHPHKLLFRLFHEEGVRVYPTFPVHHVCRCSRERVENIILTLPDEEVQDLLKERGKVEVNCEFCSRNYTFSGEDIQNMRETSK